MQANSVSDDPVYCRLLVCALLQADEALWRETEEELVPGR